MDLPNRALHGNLAIPVIHGHPGGALGVLPCYMAGMGLHCPGTALYCPGVSKDLRVDKGTGRWRMPALPPFWGYPVPVCLESGAVVLVDIDGFGV